MRSKWGASSGDRASQKPSQQARQSLPESLVAAATVPPLRPRTVPVRCLSACPFPQRSRCSSPDFAVSVQIRRFSVCPKMSAAPADAVASSSSGSLDAALASFARALPAYFATSHSSSEPSTAPFGTVLDRTEQLWAAVDGCDAALELGGPRAATVKDGIVAGLKDQVLETVVRPASDWLKRQPSLLTRGPRRLMGAYTPALPVSRRRGRR
jgi:dihydropteroate synthase